MSFRQILQDIRDTIRVIMTLTWERRNVFKELHEKNAELRRALTKTRLEDHAKSEFLAILGHELRNPLAPIISTLELLQVDEKDHDRASLISDAQQQAAILKRLLDDLLDISRITHGKFDLKKEPLTLQTVLEQSIASMKPFLEDQQIAFSVSLPSEPLWVYGDPARLVQIFNNLLHNAGNCTPHHGSVTLALKQEGAEGVIQVADTGVGIDPALLDSIFEAFISINPASQVRTGLGIGLSLVKRLTELHGGRVQAQSRGKGFGSTFTVRLPLLKHDSPLRVATAAGSGQMKPSTVFKILLVDDNEIAARGMGKLLEYKGHQVCLRYTGKSALTAIPVFQPDVILLDIGLPDISGYDVARQVLRATSQAPRPVLIALTGFGQVRDKKAAAEAGMEYHLTKPVSIADIEAILARIASERRDRKHS
ncbi:response regulator [Candidatus Kaiserbacteria bacterium]|nr:response regulator [Candidatus Kaiserbacteria bacterium]